jgi:hypothetical protein
MVMTLRISSTTNSQDMHDQTQDDKMQKSFDRLALLSDAVKVIIASRLPLYAIGRLTQCCSTFRDACVRRSIWLKTLPNAFHLLAREHAQSVDERGILRRWIECSSLDARVMQVTQNEGSVPGARFLHRAVRLGQKMLVFGGKSAVEYFDECWSLDLVTSQWERMRTDIDAPTPEPRCASSLTCVNGSALLFGGRSRSEQFLSDMWRLEVTDGSCDSPTPNVRWTLVDYATDSMPVGRWAHSAVAMHGRMILFGGSNRKGSLSDLWLFDPIRCAWVDTSETELSIDTSETDTSETDTSETDPHIPRPCARGGHSMACISENEAVVFGGNDMRNTFNDVWVLRFEESFLGHTYVPPRWTRLDKASDKAPPPRVGHTMNAVDDRIVVFGGRNFLESSFDDKVYILDVTNERWHVRSARDDETAKLALHMTRTGHSAIEYNGSVLVFGGLHNVDRYQNVFLSDLLLLSLVGSDIDTCSRHCNESPVVRLRRVDVNGLVS